jgi:hypothetical protein
MEKTRLEEFYNQCKIKSSIFNARFEEIEKAQAQLDHEYESFVEEFNKIMLKEFQYPAEDSCIFDWLKDMTFQELCTELEKYYNLKS